MTFIRLQGLERTELIVGCCVGAASITSLAGGQLLTEAAGGGRDEGLVRMIGRIVESIKNLQPGNVSIIPAGVFDSPTPILFPRAPAAPRARNCALHLASVWSEHEDQWGKSEMRVNFASHCVAIMIVKWHRIQILGGNLHVLHHCPSRVCVDAMKRSSILVTVLHRLGAR